MSSDRVLLDPTAERAPARRQRVRPPDTLEGKTVALLDIGKARSAPFLDELEALLRARGAAVKRYEKPTFTRTAPIDLAQAIARDCHAVVEALAD